MPPMTGEHPRTDAEHAGFWRAVIGQPLSMLGAPEMASASLAKRPLNRLRAVAVSRQRLGRSHVDGRPPGRPFQWSD